VSRIIVSDSALRPEARQLAIALTAAKSEFLLVTSVFFEAEAPALQLMDRYPAARRWARLARRRSEARISKAEVRQLVFPDIARSATRLVADHRAKLRMEALIEPAFGRVAARLLQRDDAAIASIQGGALELFRRAIQLGVPRVLFANTPHLAGQQRLIAAEEARLGIRRAAVLTRSEQRIVARVSAELELASTIVANSTFTALDLIDHGVPREKILTQPLGVDVSAFERTPGRSGAGADGPPIILFVGSVDARKGVIHLAHAAEKLRRHNTSCVVHAYGLVDSTYAAHLERFLQSGTLVIKGPAGRDELLAAYNAATVFVLPTLSDGFGLVVYEAMAAGTPVIVTDRCGAEVREGYDVLVVPHADVDALAHAVRSLLVNPARRQALAAAASKNIMDRSWARYHAGLLSQLQDRLGPGAVGPASAVSPTTDL
jgi:glycosyltransferase involved in cell wall biosynthesis